MPAISQLLSRQAAVEPNPATLHYPASDDQRPKLIAACIVGLVLAVLSTAGRLLARIRTKAAIRADDYLILAGLVMAIGVVISTFAMVHYGLGRHINFVTQPGPMVHSVVASQVLYALSIIPIKLSILALYHRLFPSPNLKKVSIAIAVLTVAYSIAQAIVMGLQCMPLDALWNPLITNYVCLNMVPFYIIMAVINVATDFAILTLPIPYIWRLSLQKARKVQLIAVFLTGAAVIAFGIVRAVNVGSASPDDTTWSDVPAALWSVLEVCVGVTSANLPCLRPLFFWLPSAIRGSSHTNQNSARNKLYGAGASGTANKRSSMNRGHAYEMARRSKIIATSNKAGWESLDDSQALTRSSDDGHEKRTSVIEASVPVLGDSRGPSPVQTQHAPPQSIMVHTTIEHSYESRPN